MSGFVKYKGMPARFVAIDRNTPMLLPVDLNEWLPANHPARLLVNLIDSLDLSAAAVNDKGTGSCQYPPAMMLSLITYAYSHGIFSSRKIESLAVHDIAVKFICAMAVPDHDTICKFRRENGELVKSVFVQSLMIAGEMGIIQIGSLNVTTDGTKLKANTNSQPKTVKAIDEEIGKIEARQKELELEVDQLLQQAETTDSEEENLISPIPAELADPELQRQKLAEAQKIIRQKERRKANLEAAKAVFADIKEARSQAREELREEIKNSEYGTVPKSLNPEVKDDDKVNIADPEASKMHNYRGYQEGYNAQLIVDVDGSDLILGNRLSDQANDRNELPKNIAEVENNLGAGSMETASADRGYDTTYHIAKLEENGGPTMLVDQQGRTKKETEAVAGNGDDGEKESTGPADDSASTKPKPRSTKRRKKTTELRDAHYERLKQPEYHDLRQKRKTTVEPKNGYIKQALGFRQFSLRGLVKAAIELDWVSLASNISFL
jgi:transposase